MREKNENYINFVFVKGVKNNMYLELFRRKL